MKFRSQSLSLYQELIPKLAMRRKKWIDIDPGYAILNDLGGPLKDHRAGVTIFDCRLLPTAFVDDTGDAVFEELKNTKIQIHLPFVHCYFEFADAPRMIYAIEIEDQELDEKELAELRGGKRATLYPRSTLAVGHSIDVYDLSVGASVHSAHGVFGFDYGIRSNPSETEDFFHTTNTSNTLDANIEAAAKRALAIIVLLSEELVIDGIKPDPTPRISKERVRTQKLPVSGDTHVLTINVPIVRHKARMNTRGDGTHEPPALHWRRGHWRIYHRGSNFEKTGWVQRCLVGDPDKGYIRRTQYRLVHRPVEFRVIEGGKRE